MDRSFLTSAAVVEASREFVCIRLATYEDREEARFLKQIFTGRSGELENTVFCLLAPDGRQRISRAGRGPGFRSDRQMAAEMRELARQYESRNDDRIPRLPQLKNVRLGLNVARCDNLPLLVCLANSQEALVKMHRQLAPLAFSPELAGRLIYASSTEPAELKAVRGTIPESGFLVIDPGTFGVDGELETTMAAGATTAELSEQLRGLVTRFDRRQRQHHQHVREGRRKGLDWETEIPVTDPMSNQARERGSGSRRRKR